MKPARSLPVIVGLPDRYDRNAATRRCGDELCLVPKEKLDLVNGYVFDVPEDQLDQFRELLPEEATLRVDEPIHYIDPEEAEYSLRSAPSDGQTPFLARPDGLQALHHQGLTGKGVTVAVIDSGLYPHADFQSRIKAFADMTSNRTTAYDPHGHGTNVSGILAGDGPEVGGVAPEASLVGVRITNAREAIRGLEWVIAHKEQLGIQVVNMSLGDTPRLPAEKDPFAQATQKAIDAGLVVVVAAGNECRSNVCPGTISTPGTLPAAITVGALDDKATADHGDDSMYQFSSHGPTRPDGVHKPDLVAPGVGVYGPLSPDSELDHSDWPHWHDYLSLDGTSQATPMVAGVAALMLEADPSLTHQQIKSILMETADPLAGVDPLAQGAGRLDAGEALARSQPSPR
ncbi:MAG: S8 family peptidase [Candidatus Eremiobacteraeota bacterium]|nr:S8 family peptidase [Candidatus Eremiobacteraeota bacterium]